MSVYNETALIGTGDAAAVCVVVDEGAVGPYSLTAVATDDGGATATSDAVTVQVLPPPPPTPFGGTPWQLPGLIDAENFDTDAARLLTTRQANAGGQYRRTDIHIDVTSDVEAGTTSAGSTRPDG